MSTGRRGLTCGSSPLRLKSFAPSTELNVPSRVETDKRFGHLDDRFELGAKVNMGSQGIVYDCVRLNTGEKFAAKVINCSLYDDAKMNGMLKREICITRELHHPNIVNILTAFWERDSCTIVMDLARGGDLSKKLEVEVGAARKRDAVFRGLGGHEKVSQHIARQLLEGIDYMHLNNVVHRDLKLENVLITSSSPACDDGATEMHDVKISDFGLSVVLKGRGGYSGACVPMSAVGTPAYLAPEVLDESYGRQVDLWSFGVVLYVLLCGRMPFTISSLLSHRHRVAVSKVGHCDSWQLASRQAQSIVLGLLNVNPAERLTSGGCLAHPWLKGRRFAPAPAPDSLLVRQISASTNDSGDERWSEATIGVVSRIVGVTGPVVSCAELSLLDGSLLSYGGQAVDADCGCMGERAVHTLELDAQEFILGVMQAPARGGALLDLSPNLGDALVFYTSTSRILALQGKDARRRHRFVAPTGWQIIGLQFDGPQLTGTYVERAGSGGAGSVAQISGWVSSVVCQVTLHLRDGSSHRYGSDSGREQGPWVLGPSERILVVEQGHRERGLGISLVFYTSAGNVYKFAGVTSVRSMRFAAPSGSQVCGLSFEDGVLTRVQTCPLAGNLGSACWQELVATGQGSCAPSQPSAPGHSCAAWSGPSSGVVSRPSKSL